METMITQARAELVMPRRARESPERRREKKVTYRNYNNNNNAAFTARNVSSYPLAPEESFPRQNNQLHLQTPNAQLQINDLMGEYFEVDRPSTRNQNLSPILHQNFPDDSSWFSLSPTYTLASNQPSSPQTAAGHDGYSPRSEVLQMSNNGQSLSWNAATPGTGQGASEMEEMSFSDMQLGSSLGSFNSMVFSARGSATSSLSDGWNFPILDSTIESSMTTNQLRDLTLPDEYFQTGPIFDVANQTQMNPVSSLFPQGISFDNPNWCDQVYPTEGFQPYDSNLITQQEVQSPHTLPGESFVPNDPWDSQNVSNYQLQADPGMVAFEMPRGDPYKTHIARQELLDTGQRSTRFFSPPQPTSPGDSDSDGWRLVSYPGSSCAASQDSPEAAVSPPAQPPSPPQTQVVISRPSPPLPKVEPQSPPRLDHERPHSHIFSTISGISKQKLPRGRQRGLTAKEKKEARDVREAKACWACHISKTKCSPCSPGKPCEQCARLAGKRRFCLFSCFNDPLETLFTFLVPDYLMGHFTEANVAQFVAKNASSWGTQYFHIRMDWGYRRYLTAEVVALALRNNSEMGYQHQTLEQEGTRPALVRKQSPPLGIPLAAMDDMQDMYSRYIQDIVQNDLPEYVPVAYPDQETDFAERLLGVIGNFYSAGHQMDNESELLRRALEMHVTAVILERSLILDSSSLHQVEQYLQQQYPERSAPRCAQRQIKLAFFLLQQRRIMRVLKDWGSMMWATNSSISKDKEWALAFSVFVTLILVMDKTLGAAYYFCEGRIRHHGHQAGPERAEFENLVRLTQKELFERCKEIFHWKFKTRKGGKEACNPIRDGAEAFHGKSKSVDPEVMQFVRDLQNVVGEFELDVRSHRSSRSDTESEYTDAGRLACIFLDDFLSR
ncbi:uncharacterized protein LY89DRAFT_691843 [Mollisia scopiformis]|uniref:Zn(2)-C6 fungal-type domain-containing protein n=1 Tax=Mollisia scopiformis TaxID=149040 RepID=A0A132B682_MOLSC|nr:uncharacterized protein LY89DRAFT_691843 [Mollisia scopiformis]KUJ07394.1 hypothetical protein LY89DRAFT_691843 [Mollisia scopiformis]